MFLPHMARRGHPEPTNCTCRNPSKNGDEVNPINSGLRVYGVLGDVQDVHCAYVALHTRVFFVKWHVADRVSSSKNKSTVERSER